jgi:hypothetical protein
VPRHVRNILIAVLLAVLALAAGINGYVHHQFKTNIDNSLSALQMFAQVKYSDLSTSLISGKVELKNVRVSAQFLPETITVGDVTLETPGFLYMLSGPENAKKGELPDHLGISIDNFFLDMNGETAEWLDKLVKRMQPIYAENRKICGGKAIFGPSEYKEMGYTRVMSNMRMAYDFNKSQKTINIDINGKTRNMGSVKANVLISNISTMKTGNMAMGGMPKLTSVEVVYKDDTYTPRVLKYCSEQDKTDKQKFIEAEVKQPDEYFYKLWGFAPGHGLREAYKDFLLKPDLVTLNLRPSAEFNPMALSMMSSEEIMDALNIRLKINGLLVTDLSYKPAPQKFVEDFNRRIANSLDFNAIMRGEPIKPPEPVVKPKVVKKKVAGYYKITVAQAPQHIRDFVRITTKTGNTRKGQLMRIDKNNLYVQKKVSGGKFTMTVPRSKIKTIEAYFAK